MLYLLTQAVLAARPWMSNDPGGQVTSARSAAMSQLLDDVVPSSAGYFRSSDPLQPPSSSAEVAPTRGRGEDESAEYSNIYPKFSLSVGGLLLNNFNSSIQVSGASGAGAILDMEDLLDLDSESSAARFDLHYSFNKRHWIDASYFDIERSGSTASTSQDIDFGDISIPAGSSVDTQFDTRIFKVAYRYNFVTDERTVIGASFGVHSMGLGVALDAAALSLSETFRQELPLPLFGLHGAYALSRKWALLADAEILQFDLGSYRGFVGENQLALNNDTFEHFGWGLSLSSFRVNGSAEGNGDLEADLDYGYQGVMLYLRYFL